MNPWGCGYYNHPEKECTCPPGTVGKYLNKISGPLLDRIDLHVEVIPVSFDQISSTRKNESSATIRERVVKTRELQTKRFENFQDIHCNAMIPPEMVKEICDIGEVGKALLKKAMKRLDLSARAYDRILKVSITDLEEISIEHLAEAIEFRSLEREILAG